MIFFCLRILFAQLLISSLLQELHALVQLPPNMTVPAIFAFGDSILDAGMNNDYPTLCKTNHAPYGRDFKGSKPTGRFSNGYIPTDILAQELGIKEMVPSYLDEGLSLNDMLTGVSFACGCSGWDPSTSRARYTARTLAEQYGYFEEYIVNMKLQVGDDNVSSIVSQAVYLVGTGVNDFLNNYDDPLSERRRNHDLASYTDLLIRFASNSLKALYSLGARRIGIFNIPPYGHIPFSRTTAGGIFRAPVADFDNAANLFNFKLQTLIDSLNRNFPGAKFAYLDIYSKLMYVIENAADFGCKVNDRGCCGTGLVEMGVACNGLVDIFSCKNNSEYVFWDAAHPTEQINQYLVTTLTAENLHKFF
ncbi:hypothetical protein Droror1_Dr00022045 [Drosera rotundifolia]